MKNKVVSIRKKHAKVVESLCQLLAETYLTYLRTQNYHWNVKGEHFYSAHKMFEGQYEELADATDEIAERIRALGAKAPASFEEYIELSSIADGKGQSNYDKMLADLLSCHETISKNLVKFFAAAQDDEDEVTLDLMIERKDYHDKTAWMLRSTLGK